MYEEAKLRELVDSVFTEIEAEYFYHLISESKSKHEDVKIRAHTKLERLISILEKRLEEKQGA